MNRGPRPTPERRPTVLLMGPGPHSGGGIATMIRCALESDLGQRYRVELVATDAGGASCKGPLRQARRAIGVAARLTRAVLEFRPRLVHIHSAGRRSFLPMSVLAAISRCLGRPVVMHMHFADADQLHRFIHNGTRLRAWWLRQCLRRAVAVVGLSESVRRYVAESIGPQRSVAIPNATDFPELEPREPHDGSVTVLFVGHILRAKGVFDLVDVAARFPSAGARKVRFALTGGKGNQPADYDALVDTVRCAGLTCVEVTGPLTGSALLEQYRDADIFVLPSHTEQQPVVLLEAMASALPIVSTAVGAIPEMIGPDQGILVPPRDCEALFDAISALAEDEPRRIAMARRNVEVYRERYRVEHHVRAVECLYEGIIGRGRGETAEPRRQPGP